MSTLATEVLAKTKPGADWPDMAWLIQSARSLAASVLSQDETKGNADGSV